MPNVNAMNQMPQSKPMTDEELVAYCMEEIGKGIGGNVSADNDADITLPLDYYLGRQPGLTKARAKDKNASRYVSQDVMDGIESTVEEIMPAFTTDEIGFYEPLDEEDEDSARAESDIVNYLFMEEYDGFTILQTALKDAFLHRNCTGKVCWDERVEPEYETFENVPELALPSLLEPEGDNQTIEVVEQRVEQEGNPEAQQVVSDITSDPALMQAATPEDAQIGQALMGAAQATYTIKVKRMTKVGRPLIMNVPPEQTVVQSGHNSVFLHNCGFVAHESLETQSSMIAQGYDPELINQLPDHTADVDNLSRSREPDEYDLSSSHRSTRTLRVFECYPAVDFDGDGIAERRKVVISANKLLSNEEYSSVAMIGGATCLMPHKYKGISMFDRLKDVQDAKTPVMRSVIDGTQLSSNPRLGVVTGNANIDDILTSRTGGIVRADSAADIFEVPNPQVPQSSYMFLEHMDGVRRDRGGGAVDQSPQSQSVGGDTAHGLERVMSRMELGNALSARNLGETFIRGIFIEMHNILRQNHPKGKAISAKIGGKWVSTVPSDWKRRTKVTIQVGASLAERARQSVVLTKVIELQDKMLAEGSPMYDKAKHYTAIADAIKLQGIRSPERYFVDPTTPEGQAKQEGMTKQQQEMQAKEEQVKAVLVQAQDTLAKAEAMKAKADNDANIVKAQNEGLKNDISRLTTELTALAKSGELQFKYAKLAEDTAIKLTELEMEHKRELDEMKESNKPNGGDDGAAATS